MTWDKRFFATTRGRIIALLRRKTHTVDELASALDLTDNGVRAHLSTLERDGLVRQQGVRRGAGKPAYSYELTADAERLFPRPYPLVLRTLLDVLVERSTTEEVEAHMREVGRRLAAGLGGEGADQRVRVVAAVAVLNELGGLAELEEEDGGMVIRGYSCPLAEVVLGHPEVCRLAESLLTELVGASVAEHCDRSEPARCCFEVAQASPYVDLLGSS